MQLVAKVYLCGYRAEAGATSNMGYQRDGGATFFAPKLGLGLKLLIAHCSLTTWPAGASAPL